ncbi:MAG: hypothetical protein V4473_02355 [Patescibacteria group bacterium]
MNKKTIFTIWIPFFAFLVGALLFAWKNNIIFFSNFSRTKTEIPVSTLPANVQSVFQYNFSVPGVLYESGTADESSSPYWWLDSGGQLIVGENSGKTIHGSLGSNNNWRLAYANANPEDTNNGYNPQNIFRLITRNTWHDFEQEAYFKIDTYNISTSINRNESNGLLLFNRYVDGDNLYYTGIRVDGAAVIKKKYKGVYYTLAYKQFFPGTYNIVSNPNLLPQNVWIGIRSQVVTSASSTVHIKLYTDIGKTGNWKLVAEAIDDGISFGGEIIDNIASGGIRTDFMDVDFKDYKIKELE